MKPKKFKVYAQHKFGYEAPWMLVESSNKENAIKEGMQRSRLSDFENDWVFKATEINR